MNPDDRFQPEPFADWEATRRQAQRDQRRAHRTAIAGGCLAWAILYLAGLLVLAWMALAVEWIIAEYRNPVLWAAAAILATAWLIAGRRRS